MLEPTNPNLAIARRKDARSASGLQKKEVAECLGLTKSGYTPYEKGHHQFTIEEVIRICRILGRSVEWFLGLETGLTEDEDELLTAYRAIASDEIKLFVLNAARGAPKK